MKHFLLLIAIAIAGGLEAQVNKVSLEASGLTCSMCSNAILKSLKTLDCIDKIVPDMTNYTFEITFKAGSEVDFNKIKSKVEDAGFSVSGFVAAIWFEKITLKEAVPIRVGNNDLYFVNSAGRSLSGIHMVKVLDKGFVPAKEYRRSPFSNLQIGTGAYHVSLTGL